MSSSITLRGVQLLPLWRRRIPKYPVYWKGDPQRRLFLPLFWMRMIKPEHPVPKNEVHFETHPQMSHFDIKNYLEKIYKVPVLTLRTEIIPGEEIKNKAKGYVEDRHPDKQMAYLILAEGHEFTFPEIFKEKGLPSVKELKDLHKIELLEKQEERKHWQKSAIPPWFRGDSTS